MYRQPSLWILAITAGALIGAVGTWMWSGTSALGHHSAGMPAKTAIARIRLSPPKEHGDEHPADVIQSLTRVLDDEINERRVLTEQLEELKAELQDLKQNLRVRVEEAYRADASSARESPEEGGGLPMEERLVAAGFTRQQQEAIRLLTAEAQMSQIELDDRARREGWLETPRYFQEARELGTSATALRRALGDEVYDRYLTASGLPNRIAVGSIIEASPAQKAGLQRGDVIVRYAGETVYSSEQLVELRSSGVRAEPVAVEVQRDGRLLQLTMPRGPMGMSTGPVHIDPAAPQE